MERMEASSPTTVIRRRVGAATAAAAARWKCPDPLRPCSQSSRCRWFRAPRVATATLVERVEDVLPAESNRVHRISDSPVSCSSFTRRLTPSLWPRGTIRLGSSRTAHDIEVR